MTTSSHLALHATKFAFVFRELYRTLNTTSTTYPGSGNIAADGGKVNEGNIDHV